MGIKLVVFDIAGTTLQDDDNVATCLVDAFAVEHMGIDLSLANTVMGYPKPIAIGMLLEKQGVSKSEDLVERIHQSFQQFMVNFYATSSTLREKEGASELFRLLRQKGVAIFLDTGFDRPTTNVILDRMGWTPLINGTVSSDEVAQGRPFPDTIFHAMKAVGITDTQEVAKVGDTPSDLEGGTAAGCRYVIGITTGATAKADLILSPHTHIADRLAEIPGILFAA